MKKILILCALVLSMGVLYAQDNKDSAVKEELATTQIIDKVFDRTTEAINDLAFALKVPAEHVYSVLVKQQVVKSISSITAIFLFFILTCIGMWIPYKSWVSINAEYRKENPSYPGNYHDFDDSWWVWVFGFSATIFVIVLITIGCILPSLITGLLNPEYGAIKDIMSVL
jgi:hypothetical protein